MKVTNADCNCLQIADDRLEIHSIRIISSDEFRI